MNNIVQDARYGGNGGAIYNADGGTIELKGGSHLTGNEATCPEDRDCYNGTGGAIFNAGNITIENATFNANKAISGSAIWSEGNLTDTNSHYHRNSALATGAITHKQPIGKPLGTTILNNPTISRNTAGQSGAGIFDSGNIVINGGIITKNIANSQGGAIRCEPLTNPHVTPKLCLNRTTVSDNVAGTNGDAIYIAEDIDRSPILDLCNAYIFGNKAQNGGAIYSSRSVTIQFGSGAMTNITNNIANSNGGGIFLGRSSILNTNNAKITYNSAKAGKGGGIYLDKGSSIKRGHDEISNNTPDNIYQAK
jgi:predicted outer membrane repeat protein